MVEYNVVKSERKTDFIIQKRAKKSMSSDSHGPTLVSPIKIIKITDRSNPSFASESKSSANNINNLLSTKKLEPVQVHSIILTVGREKNSSPSIDEAKSVINENHFPSNLNRVLFF